MNPTGSSPKISLRAWFSPEEYKQLYEATRKRAQEPKKKGFNWEAEQLHDFVVFAVNTGLRPDEAWRLQFRDIIVVTDEDLGQTILEIEVRGKRGVGYCKSMPGAVKPFERLRSRLRPARIDGVNTPEKSSVTSAAATEPWRMPEPTDFIFLKWQRELFKTVFEEQNLRFDRDGRPRTAYGLRHTYICLRLMEGADIHQIAKNCRTSGGDDREILRGAHQDIALPQSTSCDPRKTREARKRSRTLSLYRNLQMVMERID